MGYCSAFGRRDCKSKGNSVNRMLVVRGARFLLKFVAHEGEEDQDEDDVAEETAEWGAFGFLFTLGVLSFGEAKPRNHHLSTTKRKTNSRLRTSWRDCDSCGANCTSKLTTSVVVGLRRASLSAPTAP